MIYVHHDMCLTTTSLVHAHIMHLLLYTIGRHRHHHHQERVASLAVVNQARATIAHRLGRPVVRAESRAADQVHRHGHRAVANRARAVVHRLLGVLAERVASLEVTLRHHQAHLAVTNGPNLLMAVAVEVDIRRPSLHIPNHRTLNHRILNQATLSHPTLNQVTLNHRTLNQVTHLISPRMTVTMAATVANGARALLLAARRHGHRAVESRVRAEEDLQAHRVVGAEVERQGRFEGISGIRL